MTWFHCTYSGMLQVGEPGPEPAPRLNVIYKVLVVYRAPNSVLKLIGFLKWYFGLVCDQLRHFLLRSGIIYENGLSLTRNIILKLIF